MPQAVVYMEIIERLSYLTILFLLHLSPLLLCTAGQPCFKPLLSSLQLISPATLTHSLTHFSSNSSFSLLLFHPLSPVQWPLSKYVFVSFSEAQCVSARWPKAAHDQWTMAKTIRQGTPLLAVPPLLPSHHLWFCCCSFPLHACVYCMF